MTEMYKDIQRLDWLDRFWKPWLKKEQEKKDKTLRLKDKKRQRSAVLHNLLTLYISLLQSISLNNVMLFSKGQTNLDSIECRLQQIRYTCHTMLATQPYQ
jgi:hypothetical protein